MGSLLSFTKIGTDHATVSFIMHTHAPPYTSILQRDGVRRVVLVRICDDHTPDYGQESNENYMTPDWYS